MKTVYEPIEMQGIHMRCSTAGGKQLPAVLILHGAEGAGPLQQLQNDLASDYRVLLPSHPGFDMSPRPSWMDSIEDLAFFYLDLLKQLKLNNVNVIGFDIGGWIAAEMAVRNCQHLHSLTLVDSVGIKVSPRDIADIADVFTVSPETVSGLQWHDPAKAPKFEPKEMPDEELETLLCNQEMTTFYTWRPFMHNPKLLGRLPRIEAPTMVVWGESDKVVTPDYGKAFAKAIPGATFAMIEKAGHFPHLEQKESFTQTVKQFLANQKEVVAK